MKNIINPQSVAKLGRLWLAALALAPLAASCGMVDAPTASTTPVTDVKAYYTKLETPKMQYHYTTTYASAGAAATPNTLEMEMYGRAAYDHLGMPTYGCDWTFQSGFTTKWYYALSQDSAVDLGDTNFGEHWTDLKAPLTSNSSWTFTRESGEAVTAKVTSFGATVNVNGHEFSDVIAVSYTGNKGTTSVRWFAKDVGMIFGHTVDADGSTREEKFVDMGIEN
jgi:hypothetical protein